MLIVGIKRKDSRQDNRRKKLSQQRLEHGQASRERVDRRDVAESKRRQRCQAVIEIRAQSAILARGELEAGKSGRSHDGDQPVEPGEHDSNREIEQDRAPHTMRSDAAGAEHDSGDHPHHGEQAKDGADPLLRLDHRRTPDKVGDQGYRPDSAGDSNYEERAVMIRSKDQQENQTDDDDPERDERGLETLESERFRYEDQED